MKKKYIIPILFAALIIIDALADALFFNGQKSASKNVEVLYKIGLFSICLLYSPRFDINYIVCAGIIYFFLQMALFDLSFNLFAGLDLTYRGTTSISDKVLDSFSKIWIWVWRGWWLFLAIFIHILKFRIW